MSNTPAQNTSCDALRRAEKLLLSLQHYRIGVTYYESDLTLVEQFARQVRAETWREAARAIEECVAKNFDFRGTTTRFANIMAKAFNHKAEASEQQAREGTTDDIGGISR